MCNQDCINCEFWNEDLRYCELDEENERQNPDVERSNYDSF